MKIGILTWFDVLNYGSVFQAYALQEQLKKLGSNVVILKHDRIIPNYYGNTLKEKSFIGLAKWIRNQSPNRVIYRSQTREKFKLFDEFKKNYLNVENHYSKTDSDIVLLGSDQIFDINSEYYPFQFGKGISCSNISTYAPCFGETTFNKLTEFYAYNEIVDSIKSLSVVNARDENTQQILEKILNYKIPIVLDPTLLYSFEKEKKKWNNRLINKKYCLIYTWGGITTSNEFANKCQKFAKENNLILVSVGEKRKWCDIQYSSASPIQFFELFMYADVVLTNMFHGTCFSILMERPFYSFVMPHNHNKLSGLLKYLNLDNQIISDIDSLPKKIPRLNYVDINKELMSKRKISMDNLFEALKIKNER